MPGDMSATRGAAQVSWANRKREARHAIEFWRPSSAATRTGCAGRDSSTQRRPIYRAPGKPLLARDGGGQRRPRLVVSRPVAAFVHLHDGPAGASSNRCVVWHPHRALRPRKSFRRVTSGADELPPTQRG